MELSDLHVFRTVVEAGGVTHAAKRLHRVQSNVTARIHKLEADLQAALFIREHRRLRLTPAGRILLDYAERLLGLAEEAKQALHVTEPRGVLRIGTMESTAGVRLPGPLSDYHRRFPEVAIELGTGSPRDLIAAVLAGQLDAALVAEPVSDVRLESVAVFNEALVLVSDRAQAPIRSARDLKHRSMLAFHPGCPHRERLERWFARDGVAIERVVELASYHTMLGCIVAGMGVALMPRSVLDSYAAQDRLRVHALDKPFDAARTLLVWRKGAPQPKIERLAEILLAPPTRPTKPAGAKSITQAAKAPRRRKA
ncbi:LysR family transcriptional regulator [Ferrovibrio sp.]|uniref:LysR family transcriptional regulator n=1 Tax=Ferrovibrio sp. TaxID=1917215 RepID=UPI00260CE89A|nr:LysR family transcriptional regulator [Ferrovibrio sp.]